MPEVFAQARRRRLKRPDNRIRCALSNVSTDPVSFCHHTRKPPTAVTLSKIRIQNDTVHAVVTAAQKILIERAELIRHACYRTREAIPCSSLPTHNSRLRTDNCFFADCAGGNLLEEPLFRSAVSEKA